MKYILKAINQAAAPQTLLDEEESEYILLTIKIQVGIEGDTKGFDRIIEPLHVRCEMADTGAEMSHKCTVAAIAYLEAHFNDKDLSV